jgi:DNA polymerase-3 subunit alpha
MKIASTLANFSLADADILRSAMSKKKVSEMAKQKEKFLEGAKKNKVRPRKAEKIFDLMAKFAEYGFNKSHSAAYAYVAYQTAYLKAHYPVEFMAALLSSEMDNTDKVVKHINECREKNIEILPPDANESVEDFKVKGNKIRFGLAAVKNVGRGAIESIKEVREKKGKFTSLFDFCEKVDLRKVNKKVLESLIKCGAFDSLNIKRSRQMSVLDQAVEKAQRQRLQKEREKNQLSMFQYIEESSGESETDTVIYPDIPEWGQTERLSYEKECLGFYVTGHPLDNFKETLKACTTTDTAAALSETKEKEVMIGGIVSAVKQITTKKGEPMGFLTFEDLSGFIEVIVFSDVYRRCDSLFKSEHPLFIKGRLSIESENNNRIIASEIVPLEKAHEVTAPDIHLKCLINKLNTQEIEKIKNILKNNPGKSKVFFHVIIPDKSETVISFGETYQTSASELFRREIESVLGKNSVSFN